MKIVYAAVASSALLTGIRDFGKNDRIYCQREGGQTIKDALAVIKPKEIGPKLLESIE